MACYVNGLYLDLNMDWNDIFSRLKKFKEGNLLKNLKSKSWIAQKCWSTKADWLQTLSPKGKKKPSNRNSQSRLTWRDTVWLSFCLKPDYQFTPPPFIHSLSQLVSFSPTVGKWAFCLSITGGLTDLNSSWSLSCDLYVCQCVCLRERRDTLMALLPFSKNEPVLFSSLRAY